MYRSQGIDPLAKRQQSVRFWRDMAKTNKHYTEPACRPLYRNSCFWEYLMPRLRAYLTDKERAAQKAWRDQMERQSAEYRRQQALKKSGPMPLFDSAAA